MPSPGAGPSRRSHTKSRKGCKTCKRRHIRCDESFPQCQNCTKHQCPCDYMDTPPTEKVMDVSPVLGLYWSPEIEAIVEQWDHGGLATLGSFTIDLTAQGHRYTRGDLHLIYYILKSGQSPETREHTVWSSTTKQALKAAQSQPFLVHAIMAFTALSMAWEKNSSEIKSVAYQYGGIALKGLQHAIATFSRENADAVLLASMLLSWQSNEWRSWTSLTTGIRSVVNSMQPFKLHSSVAHIIEEQETAVPECFPLIGRSSPDKDFHRNYVASLQQMLSSLEGLSPYLTGRKEEAWFEQLTDYLGQLQSAMPASTLEEQFNHLYHFRKFLFWIPSSALRARSRDYMTLVALAYLYSMSLQMEPLFPEVAAAFCSRMVLSPLEEIFSTFDDLEREGAGHDREVQDMLSLLSYPRQILATYKAARAMRDQSIASMRSDTADLHTMSSDLHYLENSMSYDRRHSPNFGPSPLNRATSMGSSVGSPYIETATLPMNVIMSGEPSMLPGIYDHMMSAEQMPQEEAYSLPSAMGSEILDGFVTPQLLWV